MKRIKLFESFEIESFDDIDDILLSLQEQGILKLKTKPYIDYKKTNVFGQLNPKISVIYGIKNDLLKVDSIDKILIVKKLMDEIHQAISRLDTASNYLLDFIKSEIRINLPVPSNISAMFENIDIEVHGGEIPVFTLEKHFRTTIFGTDTKSFNNFKKLLSYLEIHFFLDENFKTSVSIEVLGPRVGRGKDKDSFLEVNKKNIESLLQTLIKYFESFELEYTGKTQNTNIVSHYYQYKINFITK